MLVIEIPASPGGGGYICGEILPSVPRCPHCAIASPSLHRVWSDVWRKAGPGWAAFRCRSCEAIVSAHLIWLGNEPKMRATSLFPAAKHAHEDIPNPARTFLQQAYETLHAPDAAAVMAGSAVDAMLKHHGLTEGSLYKRIDEALARNLLTMGMADWAHSVRLGSNRPRHADETKPHVSSAEATQSVEFAEALGLFLFVLSAKINRGIEAAKLSKES